MWLNILIIFTVQLVKKIQDKIRHTTNNFKNDLKNRNSNNFILSLTTPKEISDIIQTLKLNKSTSPNSSSLKVLKIIKGIISLSLYDLINKSFTSDVFPCICIIENLNPIFKYKTDSITTNTDLSLLFQY